MTAKLLLSGSCRVQLTGESALAGSEAAGAVHRHRRRLLVGGGELVDLECAALGLALRVIAPRLDVKTLAVVIALPGDHEVAGTVHRHRRGVLEAVRRLVDLQRAALRLA